MKLSQLLIVSTIALGLSACSQAPSMTNSNNSSAMQQGHDTMEKNINVDKNDSMKNHDAMDKNKDMDKNDAMKQDGQKVSTEARYVSLDDYRTFTTSDTEGKRIFLFFNASWCPSCRSIDKALKEDPSFLPANTIIVNVDYDTNTDLRKQYGVTMQTTFVEVSPDGSKIDSWVASNPRDVQQKLGVA